MMAHPRIVFTAFIILLSLAVNGYSQADQPVVKSTIIESIEGTDYYLHFVKKGETLFAIARAYGLSVDDIFKANPDSRKGVDAGSVLKIPVKTNKVKALPNNQDAVSESYFFHIVKKQETLFGISKKYGVTIESIKKINPDMGDYPLEGETIKIPYLTENPDNAEWQGSTISHTVQQGETLYSIALAYSVTIGEIKNANPGLTDAISTGSTLFIPNQGIQEEELTAITESEDSGIFLHTVEQGETLYGIARQYGVPIDTLARYNPGISASIATGQVISIPRSRSDNDYIIHKPSKNESLDGISKMYEVDLGDVKEMNPGIRKKAKKGQSVKIPIELSIPVEQLEVIEEEMPDTPLNEHCFDAEYNAGNTYNIALMLPLFLEEIDSIDFSKEKDFEKLTNLLSFRFAGFYGGFKMAVDSMINNGMKLNLFVYDVDNDPTKAEKVLESSVLSSMDLIVGPFYLNSFNKVADFAKTYQIPIVNPLSKREEIINNNPSVFKVKPSEEEQTDLLVNYLAGKYPESNILALRHNKYKYQTEVSYIRNSLNTSRPTHIYLPNEHIVKALSDKGGKKSQLSENKLLDPAVLTKIPSDSTYFSNLVKEVIYMNDSIVGLTMNLSLVRHNIVVALSDDIVFSKEILSQLNKLKLEYDITLFGMPAWNDFNDLETNHLLNLNLHTFTPSLVNFSNKKVNDWIMQFRQTYHTEPTSVNYAFDGFDVGMYFLSALYSHGRDFRDCLPYLKVPLLQTHFEFRQTPNNGYENTYWNLGHYSNYQYRKIPLIKD